MNGDNLLDSPTLLGIDMYSIADIDTGGLMAEKSLDSSDLEEVFVAMGTHLEWDTDVDVLIVGAAALALTG